MRQNKQTRILIVDTDELSLALIRTSLEIQHHFAFSAFNCKQALDHAANEKLDLVICDCTIRTETGVPLPALIKSIPSNSEVPFLFTSASQKPDVISRRCDDRNVFFVRKPFEHEAFLELVEFAMWMPNLIRSHIEKMHQQQGLQPPHSASEPCSDFPKISIPTSGIASVSSFHPE